ncbi:ATP-dependent Clp protease ATP-binding subunit [Mycoplasmopsis lipofaciens]|uniref:ATP-dependent Clp protease ATP-binding subunit n=1 Tax=Mycoplasmopsis lipofaciens TaxID=114884 RepID=UPI0006922E4E|nr:AAA family ATPase [Mycoplasmopsis lipofaciens]
MNFNSDDIKDIFGINNSNNKNTNDDPLKKYGRNLTDLAARNELDPVINRDDEIRRMIRILSRKTKNNPVLVGEPGVGKTAIVEGLARKIVEGQVPENLKSKDIIELDLASMIAGASYQGQFEKRLKDVLKKIEDSNGDIIVFIDEIHMLIGTGRNANGGMDAANIIKPLMARGKMHLIGATTFDEYRQYIEKDAALERRMQKIDVLEPTIEDTITILRGIKDRFENFHNVKIQDDALIAAARLSSRYISDRFLPDKAIDLVDEAAATIKTEINFQPEELEKAKQKIAKLQMEKIAISGENKSKYSERINEIEKEIKIINLDIDRLNKKWDIEKKRLQSLSNLKSKLDDLRHALNIYQKETDYEKASKVLYVEIPETKKKIEQLEKEINNSNSSLIKDNVTSEEIASIVSKWTKIPINKLLESDKEKLLNLEKDLKNKIKGQDRAISLVTKAILRAKADINDPNRPLSSFLFTGPTGVGKTELARQLAYSLFDSEKQMIRLDMSEFMEKHSVSKIIGAPPGYIGFDTNGSLTEKIRKNPYTILLLDEIEKANKDVLNILLQMLDNGIITDSKGRQINCRNLIIIMTSNLGSEMMLKKIDVTFDIKEALLKFLTPEFINRIDEIIKFNSLEEESINEIVALELNKLITRIKETKDIQLEYSDKALQFISRSAYDENFGARPIKRFIQNKIESLLAYKIINGSMRTGKTYIIDVFTGNFIIKEK